MMKRVFLDTNILMDAAEDREHGDEANALLEQVAQRQEVTWINLYPLFVDDQGRLRADLTNDGLHLMGKGYLIWRDALRPYVK